MNGDDQALLPEHVHGVSHGSVGDPVFVGEIAFAGQLLGDLAGRDPPRYVVGYLDVGVLVAEWVYRLGWHEIKIGVLSDLP